MKKTEKLRKICAGIVQDYISCAIRAGIISPSDTKNLSRILARAAGSAYFEKKFPDSAGAGKPAVWFGENFAPIFDAANSATDPILDAGFSARKVLFHEFTHVLQMNLRGRGEYFKSFKHMTLKYRCFPAFAEIAATLTEQKLWSAYKNCGMLEIPPDHYYAKEVAMGLEFLGKIGMTADELIRATTFMPQIFETMASRCQQILGKNFAQVLSEFDELIKEKNG